MNAGDKTIGNNIFSQDSDSNQQSSHQELLSPPNPSPTPEKRQLDDEVDNSIEPESRNKRWKKKLRPVKLGSSKLRSAKLCLKLNRQNKDLNLLMVYRKSQRIPIMSKRSHKKKYQKRTPKKKCQKQSLKRKHWERTPRNTK